MHQIFDSKVRSMKFCLHLCLAKPVKIAGCFQPELPIKDAQRGKIKIPLFTQTWFLALDKWNFVSSQVWAKRVKITSNFKPTMSIKNIMRLNQDSIIHQFVSWFRYMKFCLQPCLAKPVKKTGCFKPYVLHMFRQVLFGAGNQGNHQNFKKSLLTNKSVDHVFMRMKQKNVFFWKKIQNGQKNLIFQLCQFSIFFMKISWIGPCVSRIDWCKGHWCGSTYIVVRLSDITSKTGKKCFWPRRT